MGDHFDQLNAHLRIDQRNMPCGKFGGKITLRTEPLLLFAHQASHSCCGGGYGRHYASSNELGPVPIHGLDAVHPCTQVLKGLKRSLTGGCIGVLGGAKGVKDTNLGGSVPG